MRTVRLVGLSSDGRSLIVADDRGEELALAADDRVRAALRGDRPRLGQLEIEMESALSPREIQSRIRSGESLSEVARVAGVPPDRVERFARPVLAEREHIASVAMTASVRRRGETSGHRGLRKALHERLLARGVDLDSIAWDAFRQGDGRWAVTAAYRSGESDRQALFLFDLPGRFSVAGNDDARWVLGEQSPSRGPQPGRRRPEPVGEDGLVGRGGEDTEPTLDLADQLALVRVVQADPDANQLLAGPATVQAGAVAVPDVDEPAADLPAPVDPSPEDEPESPLQTLYAMLDDQSRNPAADPEVVGTAVNDASAVPPSSGQQSLSDQPWDPAPTVNYPVEPSRVEEPESQPESQLESEPGTEPEQEPATEPQPTQQDAASVAPVTRSPRKKRPPVPSWDEIVFGGPKTPS